MANKHRPATCACCGAEIQWPQFYQGKAYGYSCIRKVAPEQKRVKDSTIWIKPDEVEIDEIGGRCAIRCLVNGRWYTVNGYIRTNGELSSYHFNGGLLMLADRQRKPIFNSIEVKLTHLAKGKTKVEVIDRNGDTIYQEG